MAKRSQAHTHSQVDTNDAARLGDQLKVQQQRNKFKKATTINEKRRLLDEIAFYPQHDKRKETPEYHKVHVELTVTKDLPCLVCGVKRSTLHDPKENLYGAKQMETHHHVIEWALANAIDAAKFNKALRPNLAHRHPDNSIYARDMSEQEVKDWVDHSADNLWVLCDVHHRAKFFGIHEITFPIWGPMDLLKPDFDQYAREQMKAAGAAKKKGRGNKKGGGAKKPRKKKKKS